MIGTKTHLREADESTKKIRNILPSLLGRIRNRLSPQPKEVVNVPQEPKVFSKFAETCFVSHGPFGIVDLGASQTVIGRRQIQELLSCLPESLRAKVKSVPCNTVFRFGNSSTVECHEARLVPLSKWFIKLCVVDSETPFLISNNVFRTLGAKIDTVDDSVHFAELGVTMQLTLSKRKLYLLDFCALIELASKSETKMSEIPSGHVLTAVSVSTDCMDDLSQNLDSAVMLQSQSDSSSPSCQLAVHPKSPTSLRLSHDASRVTEPRSGRKIPSFVSEGGSGGRGLLEPVLSGTGSKDDQLRRIQDRTDILPGGPHGCNLCAVVRQEVCQQHQEEPSRVSSLHQTPCGTPGSRGSVQGEPEAQPEGLQQKPSETSIVNSDFKSSSELRDMGHDPHGEPGSGSGFAEGRIPPSEPTPRSDGVHPGPDHVSTSGTDQSDADRCLTSVDESFKLSDPMTTADLCEAIGRSSRLTQETEIIDSSFFVENHTPFDHSSECANWVHAEMFQYWKARFAVSTEQIARRLQQCDIDFLEVYCSQESQLTKAASNHGLRALRFGLQQGDLATYGGRIKLYELLWHCRPRHVWVSPKCGPWSSWNRLNSQKSVELMKKIQSDRRKENVHLLLCEALFRLQDWRGSECHFHLEQPQGSELMFQKEMSSIVRYCLRVLCDMCVAGSLRHPDNHLALRKRTQVFTTSEIMARMLEQHQCVGQHSHATIEGSCKPRGFPRMPVTRYTELYTRTFASRLCRTIQASSQVHEKSLGSTIVNHHVFEAEPSWLENPSMAVDEHPTKRRRMSMKGNPSDDATVAENPAERSHQLDSVLSEFDKVVPRVGKICVTEGPLMQIVQKMFPKHVIVAIDACRGINRKRLCPIRIPKHEAPLRKELGKRRGDLSNFEDPEWENWSQLSQRQMIRATTPSRLLLTLFARRLDTGTSPLETIPEDDKCHGQPMETEMQIPESAETKDHEKPREDILQHGPCFLNLPKPKQSMIWKLHQNLGHPNNQLMMIALKRSGWSPEEVQACRDFRCPVCTEQQQPRVARPVHLHSSRDFNDLVSFDGAEWQNSKGQKFCFYHFIDTATNFHVAVPYTQRTSEGLIEAFETAWLRWAGPPKKMLFDSATEANSDQFESLLQSHSIESFVIPTSAHWQLGRAERHGAVLKNMLDKYDMEKPIENPHEFSQSLIHLCQAKNALTRHEGYTPEMLVLGKSRRLPGSNCSEPCDPSSFGSLTEETESSRFHEQLARREAARIAFVRADHCMALRRALHARTRPNRMTFQVGDRVMYWKPGKGVGEGEWHGPARVLMVEQPNLLWISHMTKLFRCAPEHVRSLSELEATSDPSLNESADLPQRSGTGVFQFRQLVGSPQGLQSNQHPNQEDLVPNVASNSENHRSEVMLPPSPLEQPDAEPSREITPFENDNPMNTDPFSPTPDASQVPLTQTDTEDELVACDVSFDHWKIEGDKVIRIHKQPRLSKFFPDDHCPVPIEDLQPFRTTQGQYRTAEEFTVQDRWQNRVQSHLMMPEIWTGQTEFRLKPECRDKVESQEKISCMITEETPTCLSAEIILTCEDVQKCLGKTYSQQETFLASAAKRQKVEVKVKDLTKEEQDQFFKAKDKEIDQWISTDTVRRVLRNKIPENQLLRTRWVLTWKSLDPIEQKELGCTRKAKARLVILGYEDPQIDSLPRDSPTLGKDSRMLALQCIASHRWSCRSFDIKTAFLRGSRQDSRILGVEPPVEMRRRMKLADDETCERLKGAYGLINAPLLWYCELRTALLNLGFIVSPLDPCLFVLPKGPNHHDHSNGNGNHPNSKIHGILGVHVDDGVGGGDSVFAAAIDRLEAKFPFGSKRQGSFVFTGIQVDQEANGDIFLNQTNYINDIPSIEIPKDRRQDLSSKANSKEVQNLRGLIGSLQYAASNTRPDLSCRLSLLQAWIELKTHNAL